MLTKTLRAPGISCMHCAMHIKNALVKVSGVKNVEVDVQNKTVVVTYDSEPVMAKIEAAMAEAGYPVAK